MIAKNTKVGTCMINRFITKRIKEEIKHFPVLLISGPRQIGKSTLLYNELINEGYAYVTLDNTFDLAVAKNDPKTFLQLHPYPLIIDEAQYAPELFMEIESIVNKSRLERGNKESNGMYILSGSQRSKLLNDAEESLAGRVCILDMNNLSLNEILEKDNEPFKVDMMNAATRSSRYLVDETKAFEYIVRGFFPALYDDLSMSTQSFYSSYISTYLKKDLREIIDITDDLKFINFLRLLASNTGQELIYDNYSKNVGVVTNTIKAWVSALVKTGVIYLVEPYNETSITKRIVKRPKLYFFDTGLAAYLCGIDSRETLQNSYLKGRFFETMIVNEIRKSYMNDGIIQELYYYRDNDQNEIDLVLIRNGELSCIEIKTGQSFNASDTKAFKKLENTKLQHGKNAIVCSADKISVISDGTLLLPISVI